MIPLGDELRIFPLGEVVLFPDTLLPLHIFEPRYRAMLADALDDDRLIGMVLLKEDQSQDGTEAPTVYPVGCAGRIVEHEQLEDGRSVLVLKGTTKFRITEELDTENPYRVIKPQPLYEAPVPPETAREWMPALKEKVGALAESRDADTESLDEVFAKLDPDGVVNYLAAALPLEVIERQSLLECATVEARYDRLCEVLDFKTAEARLGMSPGRRVDA